MTIRASISHEQTRRTFLEAAGLGLASLILTGCTAVPGQSRSDKTFTFAQLCDPQLGMGGYEHDVATFRQAVRQVNALHPDFVVICGDLVNTADERSFADFNEIKAGFDMPCYCVSGNHDVGNEPTSDSLEFYRRTVGEDYYTFEHKDHTFVVVNTQLWKVPLPGETEPQDAWLETALRNAANEGRPIVVIGHYPLFLESIDEDDEYMNLPRARRTWLLDLFSEYGVVAMLGGHTHRLIVHDHAGIQFVHGETTSKNFDDRPFGFRLWHVGEKKPYLHEFVPLADWTAKTTASSPCRTFRGGAPPTRRSRSSGIRRGRVPPVRPG